MAVVVDWVVDYYAVYGGVGVGGDYCFFDVVFVDGGEGVFEATGFGLVSAGVDWWMLLLMVEMVCFLGD